ncbi:MAG TPA: YaeQ family protein [Gammaproteobacteria bacterium]|nr:YaeQ family protein [Gammaproteobacteria bacterium]
MALKATIYKAELQVSDTDRNYYQSHSLTLAQHPSETAERLMVRLAVYALHAEPTLEFGKGLSEDEEPALWQKSLTGEIELWIEIGQPDEKRIRKACGRARRVLIYCYQNRSAAIWWQQLQKQLERFDNLGVYSLPDAAVADLGKLIQRHMQLNCTIQDGQLWLAAGEQSVQLEPELWKASSA